MGQAGQKATIRKIRKRIEALRARRGIVGYRREPLAEPSGIAFGEVASLVELRLLHECPDTGAWNELVDPALCAEVHEYLKREVKWKPHAA